ncbi:MAG TPA: sulfatase-modifying factor protein [Bacteroidetes bacterium]|nr:sulfatase-modifying factor protein [Bacteroidota bacterium]
MKRRFSFGQGFWIPFVYTLSLLAISRGLPAQKLEKIHLDTSRGLMATRVEFPGEQEISLDSPVPLFTVRLNGRIYSSASLARVNGDTGSVNYLFSNGVSCTLGEENDFNHGWKIRLAIRNSTADTVRVADLVPFGMDPEHVYITAAGLPGLARTQLFVPERPPVGVIVPDNAWEMGYGALPLEENVSLVALARRTEVLDGERRRYETILPPRSGVAYTLWAETCEGPWQNGLKRVFGERYLYDLDYFDDYLYRREDLQWIRQCYVIVLQFAWDQEFYDRENGKFTFYEFLKKGEELFGGIDVFGIWPTWPRLGIDQRNQWDLYADLPLGLEKLHELARYARENGTRFYIAYNPWDQSTREEDHYRGMARLIEAVDADGVVLDTRGSSSVELQQVADEVKPGVIMYSEGMAVPRDMPGILSGRVHDAIYMPPPLNLNKLIRPDHAIFRVCQLSQGRLHREIAISFFNGIGTEINTFAPGRPGWMEEEFRYLGETTMILRRNASVFTAPDWTPLTESLADSIWVNRWTNGEKVLYTVFSLRPEGHSGPLVRLDDPGPYHYISLWNHREIEPVKINGHFYLPVEIEAFNESYLGTRREGNVECLAAFPELLRVERKGDSLFFQATTGDRIRLWKGKPSWQGRYVDFPTGFWELSLFKEFGRYTGDYVLQLYEGEELLDERVITFDHGKPWLVSTVEKTRVVNRPPAGMVEIPAGVFEYSVYHDDSFIPYPDYAESETVEMPRFFMDKYPVTNAQFHEFLVQSGYRPDDPANFLKHWENGIYPPGTENYPVVWVSPEDARAYADWAGKRLPTEREWQYAAQGTDKRSWPWGDEFHATRCNNAFERPTPVDAFMKGASPFGVVDMVGNVWQLTSDTYDNGSYRFSIIRGGSYYQPTSSSWYVQGGPRPVNHTQMLLLVSPGFDRNATVGFRCVMDAQVKD